MKAARAVRRLLPLWLLLLPNTTVYRLAKATEPDQLRVADRQSVQWVQQWAQRSFARAKLRKDLSVVTPSPVTWSVERKSHEVLADRTVWNTPITLENRTFVHGIYMDAPAVVRVRLNAPAVAFTAQVGIDNNADTRRRPDAGSARFYVKVRGKSTFSTNVLHLHDPPVAVHTSLAGVTEFLLVTDDGGNGRGWDQCVWADAAIEMADHSLVYLDDHTCGNVLPNRSNVPFSFLYDGKTSAELLPDWDFQESSRSPAQAQQRTVRYLDPKTGLCIECQVTTYRQHAGVDWVCWLSNTSDRDTPIIEQFLPLHVNNLLTNLTPKDRITLRWSQGDGCTSESFLPHDEALAVGTRRQFTARSSDTNYFPFFNLHGPGNGCIVAIGWTGTWSAQFARSTRGEVLLQGGMASTHFVLHPGERVRTPRIVLLPYQAEKMIDGHNRFRQLMLAHYVRWRDGRPAEPPIAFNGASGLYVRAQRDQQPLGQLSEQTELATIQAIAQLGCEAYWLDAYWYPQPWHENLGNWYYRPEDFPHGLRTLSDAAHRSGMQFVLWFAPYLVSPHTRWARDYPQHIYGGGAGRGGTLKLGDTATQDFVIDWLSDRIQDWKIDIYREDLGIGEPPPGDSDRIGIAEMKHVAGFYRVWDELLKKHPQLLIDNCCGGGRRIDLEANRRAFTLWRSDYNDIGQGLQGPENFPHMATADQVMVTGLSLYIPFHTGPVWSVRPYSFRSAMSSGIALYNELRAWTDSPEMTRAAIAELKRIRPLYQGNIYPLLPLTTSESDWYCAAVAPPRFGPRLCTGFPPPGGQGTDTHLRVPGN